MKLSAEEDISTQPGAIMILDTGKQCSIAGCGKIFDDFLKYGHVKNYTGYGQKPKTFYDKNFKTADCRIFKFDQTYYKQPYDARTCKEKVCFYCL